MNIEIAHASDYNVIEILGQNMGEYRKSTVKKCKGTTIIEDSQCTVL